MMIISWSYMHDLQSHHMYRTRHRLIQRAFCGRTRTIRHIAVKFWNLTGLELKSTEVVSSCVRSLRPSGAGFGCVRVVMFTCLPFVKPCGKQIDHIDRRHAKLDQVPDEVLRSFRTLEECRLDANQIKELPKARVYLSDWSSCSLFIGDRISFDWSVYDT